MDATTGAATREAPDPVRTKATNAATAGVTAKRRPPKRARDRDSRSRTEHVNLTVPGDVLALARELAAQAQCSLSAVVSAALGSYLHMAGLAQLDAELDAEYGVLPDDPAADARWDAVMDRVLEGRAR